MSNRPHQQTLGLLLGFIGVTIFAGTVPATKIAVGELNPWFVTFARAAIAGSLAAVILLITGRRLPKRVWKSSILAGICLILGFPGFLGLALLTVPAAHSGVVLGLLPITTATLAVLFAGERPSLIFWVWSLIGAVLVTTFAIRDGATGLVLGDFYLVCAALSASFGYVISGKLSREKPGWEVICWHLVLTSPIILTGTYIFWDNAIFSASIPVKLSFAYVSLFSMFLAFFAWNAGLALGGIARVGQMQLLQTFITLLLVWLILGETLSVETLAFAAAIVVVIWFAGRARINTSP